MFYFKQKKKKSNAIAGNMRKQNSSNRELACKTSPKLTTRAPGIDGTSIHLSW
jgi:hypothetical protein